MDEWTTEMERQAEQAPAGPHEYQTFAPEEGRRFKLMPYDSAGGFDDWLSLEDLFPIFYQGVNPNRGLEGSVVEMDQNGW